MTTVLVEFWGPVSRTNGYDWLPLGRLDVEKVDIDMLKEEALKMIGRMEYRPHTNAVRFEVIRDGKKDMKITMTDVW